MGLLQATIRRFMPWKSNSGADRDLRQSFLESLAVAQVEPAGMEITRSGRRFYLGATAAVAGIAPVQAWPTTAAQWAIFNPDIAKTLWLEALGAYPISGTPGVGGQLLVAPFTTPAQADLAASLKILNARGGAAGSVASVKSAVTITAPAAPAWTPIAENASPNVAAFPGSGIIGRRDLAGRLAIPPLSGLGLAVLAPAGTTPLFVPFAEWLEAEVDVET